MLHVAEKMFHIMLLEKLLREISCVGIQNISNFTQFTAAGNPNLHVPLCKFSLRALFIQRNTKKNRISINVTKRYIMTKSRLTGNDLIISINLSHLKSFLILFFKNLFTFSVKSLKFKHSEGVMPMFSQPDACRTFQA